MTLSVSPATANGFPVKCYTRLDYGVLFTQCNDGHYGYTVRQGKYKITVWQHTKIPKWSITCRALNTRDLRPAPRCQASGMRIFG
jgi:hypothetical protein